MMFSRPVRAVCNPTAWVDQARAPSFHADDAGGGAHQTCGDLEKGCLAGAGGSQQDRNLAASKRQIHALNDRTTRRGQRAVEPRPTARQTSRSTDETPRAGGAVRQVTPLKLSTDLLMLTDKGGRRQSQREEGAPQDRETQANPEPRSVRGQPVCLDGDAVARQLNGDA